MVTAAIVSLSSGCHCPPGPELPAAVGQSSLIPTVPGVPMYHAATVAPLVGGDVLAAFYAGTEERHPDVAIYFSRYNRVARAWSRPEVLVDNPGISEGNPVLGRAPDGRLWLFYVTLPERSWAVARMFSRASSDEGTTWSRPREMFFVPGWIPRNPPIALASGEWLLPFYDDARHASLFSLSPDGGATWTDPQVVSSAGRCIQPAVVERENGSLMALMRTSGPPHVLLRSESADGGHTWSAPAPTTLPNPDSAAALLRLASGSVLLAYNPTECRRTPLALALSDDGGETFPVEVALESSEGEYSYPAMVQDAEGVIHVVYTWNRRAIKHMAITEADLRATAGA